MNQTPAFRNRGQRSLKGPAERLILQTDSDDWSRHIQEVQDAIMDEIEETFQTAGPLERQSLINAMNAVHELQRIATYPAMRRRERPRKDRDAA